ncbi:unnamed protein product [Parajaminaea phylloscopi]
MLPRVFAALVVAAIATSATASPAQVSRAHHGLANGRKCNQSVQCKSQYCRRGTCDVKKPLGHVCYKDAGCKSGKCRRKKCVRPQGPVKPTPSSTTSSSVSTPTTPSQPPLKTWSKGVVTFFDTDGGGYLQEGEDLVVSGGQEIWSLTPEWFLKGASGKILVTDGSHVFTQSIDDEPTIPVDPPVVDPPTENPPVENPPVENPPVENPPVVVPPTENPPVENPPVVVPPTENPPVVNPPVENPPVVVPPAENPPVEIPGGGQKRRRPDAFPFQCEQGENTKNTYAGEGTVLKCAAYGADNKAYTSLYKCSDSTIVVDKAACSGPFEATTLTKLFIGAAIGGFDPTK